MSKPDAWMPIWVGDYLADTMHLTAEEHGAYLLLLMAAWRNASALRDADATLATIARIPAERWPAVAEKLRPFFTVADGVWVQKRLEVERVKVSKVRTSRAAAASKAAKARHAKPASAVREACVTHPSGIADAQYLTIIESPPTPPSAPASPETPPSGAPAAPGGGKRGRGVMLAPSLHRTPPASGSIRVAWPEDIGGYKPQAVYDRVLAEMACGDLRFPDLPQVVIELLHEGVIPGHIYAAAAWIRRDGVNNMRSAGLLRSKARAERERARGAVPA